MSTITRVASKMIAALPSPEGCGCAGRKRRLLEYLNKETSEETQQQINAAAESGGSIYVYEQEGW